MVGLRLTKEKLLKCFEVPALLYKLNDSDLCKINHNRNDNSKQYFCGTYFNGTCLVCSAQHESGLKDQESDLLTL